MPQRALSNLVVLALSLSLLALTMPSMSQTAPQYLVTSITSNGVKQTVLGGYGGLFVNYTNTHDAPITALVYMDVSNSVGQVVALTVGTCYFGANETIGCFVVFPVSVPSGAYSAEVFATTTSGVPISTTQITPVAI